ncbi:MAG: methyltransferase domain-containing protein [Alphaproteobacteria bacterium]|nr:methyltransferase domain-containing protein [Alphaproteobacteria bacterium]
MDSYKKLDMASTDWLTTHFLAKSADRLRALASLHIEPGCRILDLCCGPGLYIPYLLDLVGPSGHVTGIDYDPISLDAAHRRLRTLPHHNWDLKHVDVNEYVNEMPDFDVVLIFNSIGYFRDPFRVTARIAERLPSGSSIIIKDFDLESVFIHPRELQLWCELLQAAKRRNDSDNPVSFDNFFGRKIHTLHQCYPFSFHRNEVWTQLMTYPFNHFQAEYIWRNVECLVKQSGNECSRATAGYFLDFFRFPKGEFFTKSDAIFVETEYLTCVRK